MHARAIRAVARKAAKSTVLEPVPSLGEATVSALVDAAHTVRPSAYAPYSRFKVGAAVLGASGKIYTGCNVENSSYGLSMCAERNAVGAAVAAGETRIVAAAISSQSDPPSPPCGMCRQVMAEMGYDSLIVLVNQEGAEERVRLKDLYPRAFSKDFL